MAQYQSFTGAAGDSRTLDKLKALRLPSLAGKTFLDVGRNEGFFCGFAHFQGAARSVGVDHSEGFVSRARARFPGCEFHRQGWESLPEGPFDVILLASALHYADDQPALIGALVERLSADGTLVIELGIVSSRKPEWSKVQRGIDERYFPSMPMLREVLSGYAWKWLGPSISQDGDPVPRHVIHISRRRPVAYLLMQPPGYGKSSIASGLFGPAGIPVVSGDQQIGQAVQGKREVPAALKAMITEDYSPFSIDQTIQKLFDGGQGEALVKLWLGSAGEGDVALDAYVPTERHAEVERILEALGYLPVQLRWERVGATPMAEAAMAEQAEAFYMSLVEAPADSDGMRAKARPVAPQGFIDEISIRDGQLTVRGWAVDSNGLLPARLGVKARRQTTYVETFQRQLRPDVQRHLGLPHALLGYSATISAPAVVGVADLAKGFDVFIPDGVSFQLAGPVAELMVGDN